MKTFYLKIFIKKAPSLFEYKTKGGLKKIEVVRRCWNKLDHKVLVFLKQNFK